MLLLSSAHKNNYFNAMTYDYKLGIRRKLYLQEIFMVLMSHEVVLFGLNSFAGMAGLVITGFSAYQSGMVLAGLTSKSCINNVRMAI